MAGDTSHIIQSLLANLADRRRQGRRRLAHRVGRDARRDAAHRGRLRQPAPAAARRQAGSRGRRRGAPARLRPRRLLLVVHGRAAAVHGRRHVLDLRGRPQAPAPRAGRAGRGSGLGILGVSLLLEGWALPRQHPRDEPAARREAVLPLPARHQGLATSSSSSARTPPAVLGLVARDASRSCSPRQTGDGRWDAVGSIAIGVVLVGVAVFLAVEVKSLLVGEAADPDDRGARRAGRGGATRGRPACSACITVQQGPGEVMVALKIRFAPHLTVAEVCDVINDFEQRLRDRRPGQVVLRRARPARSPQPSPTTAPAAARLHRAVAQPRSPGGRARQARPERDRRPVHDVPGQLISTVSDVFGPKRHRSYQDRTKNAQAANRRPLCTSRDIADIQTGDIADTLVERSRRSCLWRMRPSSGWRVSRMPSRMFAKATWT